MSADHPNLTGLRLGATGTLNGWRVRVAGRAVMAVEIEGEDYFWNEFRLVDGSGNEATLVHEEGEAGPEWKLFRPFTPARPMTAAEASFKSVGDKVNLDGTPVAITLVDESRVVHLEGEAAEGVEVGDVARYFNADTGDRMLVVSWTGDDIEFYEGLDVPAAVVAQAFNLPPPANVVPNDADASATSNLSGSGLRSDSGAKPAVSWMTKLVLVALGGITLFSGYSCFNRKTAPTGAPSKSAPAFAPTVQLMNGTEGTLGGERFTVTAVSAVEIARPGDRHARREYALRTAGGERALLINGLTGGSKEWHLLRPAAVPAGLMPVEAARKKKGDAVTAGGRALPIAELFQAKTIFTEPAAAGPATEAIEYGFLATEGADVLLARWGETAIRCWRGNAVAETAVSAAFAASAGKAK
jgi:hypothetical protein